MGREMVMLKDREPGHQSLCLDPSRLTSALGQAHHYRGVPKTLIQTVFVSFSKAMVEFGESNIGHSPFTRTFQIYCSLCLVPGKLSLKINL